MYATQCCVDAIARQAFGLIQLRKLDVRATNFLIAVALYLIEPMSDVTTGSLGIGTLGTDS